MRAKSEKKKGEEKKRQINPVGVVAPEFDLLQSMAIRTLIGLNFRVVPTIKKLTLRLLVRGFLSSKVGSTNVFFCSSCWMKIVAKVVALMLVYSYSDI